MPELRPPNIRRLGVTSVSIFYTNPISVDREYLKQTHTHTHKYRKQYHPYRYYGKSGVSSQNILMGQNGIVTLPPSSDPHPIPEISPRPRNQQNLQTYQKNKNNHFHCTSGLSGYELQHLSISPTKQVNRTRHQRRYRLF